jgi:MurNAc alpha-1-phosphate uridylyltransferase
MSPRRAIALSAGLGLRMRPITLTLPKPLARVMGKTLLDHALDRLAGAGVTECVVNVHHLGHLIRDHLKERLRPGILISDESDQLLETGGGVARALPLLGQEAFFAVNADILWLDGAEPALKRLAALWDETRMDALLLLARKDTAFGYEGPGDFFLAGEAGRPLRRGQAAEAPFVFAGVQILHPRLVKDVPEGPFSLNLLYDRALAEERLFALAHDGGWFHIGTPEALEAANRRLGGA